MLLEFIDALPLSAHVTAMVALLCGLMGLAAYCESNYEPEEPEDRQREEPEPCEPDPYDYGNPVG